MESAEEKGAREVQEYLRKKIEEGNEPIAPPERPQDRKRFEEGVGKELALMLARGFLSLAGGALGFLMVYGVVLLVFRHAFGVELPNPFKWLGWPIETHWPVIAAPGKSPI